MLQHGEMKGDIEAIDARLDSMPFYKYAIIDMGRCLYEHAINSNTI